MKRGADNQLTKDGVSDDEIEEVSSQAFKKADDAVLASRPMRGLPKRSLAAAPPLGTTDAQTAPKFSGFSGFEVPPAVNSPPISTSITPPQSSFLFKAPLPAPASIPVASTASNTAKSFASFLSNPNPPPKSDAAPASTLSQENASDAHEVNDPVAFKYYTSLRGLNVSFLAAVSKATEEDPFKDVTELLESYQNLRLKIQKDFDECPKESPPASSAPLAPLSMPAPPSKFIGFNAPASSTDNDSGGSKGGFVPQPTPSTTLSPGLSFGGSAVKAATPSTGGFSFAMPPPSQAGKINAFGFPTTSSSSPFGTSTFGTSASSSPPFNVPPKNALSSPATLSFGAASSTPCSSSNVFGSTASSSTASIFGSGSASGSAISSTTTPPTPGSFGGFSGFGKAPAGNIGNPVGFGFGSPTKTFDTEEVRESEEAGEGNGRTDDGQAKTASFSLIGSSPHDEEGEGEENEDTLHGVKVKAFRMKKPGEEAPGWLEIGYGVLRLKKHKETEARRILLRNSSTGKINLNFSLYAGLKVTQAKRAVTFIGHDNGASQTYSVRLQSEDQAKTLKDALDNEIAKLPS